MNIESSGIDRVVDAGISAYMDDHEAWSTNGIADLIRAAAEQGIPDLYRGSCHCADDGQYRPGVSCVDLCDTDDGDLCDRCGSPSIEETSEHHYEAGYWTREAAHSRREGDRPMSVRGLDLAADAYRRAVAA